MMGYKRVLVFIIALYLATLFSAYSHADEQLSLDELIKQVSALEKIIEDRIVDVSKGAIQVIDPLIPPYTSPEAAIAQTSVADEALDTDTVPDKRSWPLPMMHSHASHSDVRNEKPDLIARAASPESPPPFQLNPVSLLEQELNRLDKEINERVKISGRYHMGMGVGRHRTWSVNDSNSDFQERDADYLFGESLNNTFDPAIYSGYTVNFDMDITDRLSGFAQLVADPWSYIGVTSETRVAEAGGNDSIRVKLKYWGQNDSTIEEIYRADFRNSIGIDPSKVTDGRTAGFVATGIGDQNLSYSVPGLEIDHEFRPARKLWFDYDHDDWHGRLFFLAPGEQAMVTDDPLGLSGTRDFWQPSPWLAEWIPLRRFSDAGIGGDPGVQGAIKRGTYSDVIPLEAKTSYGEYQTFLRGVALEADMGRTYISGMVATPFGPWDEFTQINNVPGAIRVKHQLTPQLMLGGLYTFRVGMIDREPDAYNQVMSVDARYAVHPDVELYIQGAGSRDDIDRLSQGNRRSPNGFSSAEEGLAFKTGVKAELVHQGGGTQFETKMTWMDSDFRPHLSIYRALRDDNFWGKHMTFHEYNPDMEYFRLGTGEDIGRMVWRTTMYSSLQNDTVFNLFDNRHVRSTDKASFVENVMRDELTIQMTPQLKAKGFTRWHLLPNTVSDVEPFLGDFFFIDEWNTQPSQLQNLFIESDLDPSKFSIAGGLQYQINDQWMVEGSYERTNDIPDFPRGLQNDVFLGNAIADVDNPNILLDNVVEFLYRQDIYDLPPYDYFSIVKEKVIFDYSDDLRFTFHAAQNSYKLWGPIDEMVNHQGVSTEYRINNKTNLFMDYTHSIIGDIPNLIASDYLDLQFRHHHNVYANLRYQFNPKAWLTVEYGVFGQTVGSERDSSRPNSQYAVSEFSLPTIDTEQLIRVSVEGEF